jgi:hypothetical protein
MGEGEEGGEGAKSYDGEKAWCSLNLSILSLESAVSNSKKPSKLYFEQYSKASGFSAIFTLF